MNRGRFPFPMTSSSPRHLCVFTLICPPCRTLFTLLQKSEKINPLFSTSCALLKKECFNKSFSFNDFCTLLQNTGGGIPSFKISSFCSRLHTTRRSPQATKSRRIRTSAKHTRIPLRIRTSETKDINPFRIRAYRKTRGEGPPLVPSLRHYFITSLLQIFTQLHSFEYGTLLIRYPDFTPVTT